MSKTEAFKADLEAMVDASSLAQVIEALGEICAEKADHIRASYDDRATAKIWDDAARKVMALASKVDV